MTDLQCKAKNPATCRFHGKSTYKEASQRLNDLAGSLRVAKNYDEYEKTRHEIDRYEVIRDASRYGFHKLGKEFAKASKVGTVEEQNSLASRIKRASELRLEDGVVSAQSRWSATINDPFAFGSLVLEEAKTKDEVILPTSLTGSYDIGVIADRVNAEEGYRVEDIDVHPFSHSKIGTEEELGRVRERVVAHVREYGAEGVWDTILDSEGCGMRGLTFSDPAGRRIVVKADKVLSYSKS